jgi:tetratricopeptide (TPR) repeat protein
MPIPLAATGRILLMFGLLLAFEFPLLAQAKKDKPANQAAGWGDYWTSLDQTPSGYRTLRREFDEAIGRRSFSKALAIADKMVAGYSEYPSVYLYRAVAKRGLSQYDAARADLERGIAIAKKDQLSQVVGFGLEQLAVVSLLQGRASDAQSYFRQAERQSPNEFALYNDYAWILATSPTSTIRNGAEAMRLANKACEMSHWQDASCLDTLAAACAETGDFASAIKWQTKAIEFSKGSKGNLPGLNARLALYKNHQAYHANK